MMVIDLDQIGQRQRLARGEIVEILVGRREGPGPRSGDTAGRVGQGAERQPAQDRRLIGKARSNARLGYAGDRDAVGVAEIDIGEASPCRTRHRCVSEPVTSGISVMAAAWVRRSDHRLVVGSDDRDRDRERDDAAMMIVDLDRVGQRQRLARGEIVEISVGSREGPRSAIPSRRRSRSTSAPSDSQLSTVASLASPVVTPASVTPVMVTEWVSVRSTSVNVSVPLRRIRNGGVRRPWLLDDQTDLCRGRHDRRIIGTGNRDGDGA